MAVAITHFGALISTTTSKKSMRAPLIPTILTVKFPIGALPPAVMVKVEETAPFGAGTTGLKMFRVTPAGLVDSHEVDNETGELKPSWEFTVIVPVLLWP